MSSLNFSRQSSQAISRLNSSWHLVWDRKVLARLCHNSLFFFFFFETWNFSRASWFFTIPDETCYFSSHALYNKLEKNNLICEQGMLWNLIRGCLTSHSNTISFTPQNPISCYPTLQHSLWLCRTGERNLFSIFNRSILRRWRFRARGNVFEEVINVNRFSASSSDCSENLWDLMIEKD